MGHTARYIAISAIKREGEIPEGDSKKQNPPPWGGFCFRLQLKPAVPWAGVLFFGIKTFRFSPLTVL